MIGILLNDNAYEQDIRELLMAFYSGETFAHQKGAEVSFYVEGTVNETRDQFEIRFLDKEGHPIQKEGQKNQPWTGFPEELSGEWEEFCSRLPISLPYQDRTVSKSKIKRRLYFMLYARTGKLLPWGTLTGIRPTKIAMSRLDDGWKEEEVRDYMRQMYLTGQEKLDLSVEIAARELKLLEPLNYEKGYSLYVGIPFCPTTCLYCSFTSYPIGKWKGRTGEYLAALFKEMEYTAEKMKGRPLDTIYFGGGTPTSLDAEDLDKLLTKLWETFPVDQALEFTVEAGRPDSITREKLEVLKRHGVTRISINPQTMKQETLDIIGRHHTVDMVKDTFAMAREIGFDNINMDLIIGLPGETSKDVKATMEEVKKLGPDSITVHSLAIKRASRLHLLWEEYKDQTGRDIDAMAEVTANTAREMGLEPYYLYRQKNMAGNFENVGYAAPGKACIYNILIMEELQTIAACGAGTTTKLIFPAENRKERVENVKDADQYVERIDEMLERKEKIVTIQPCEDSDRKKG